MKNQTFRMTMLFDFYGELLTDRQKEFYATPRSGVNRLMEPSDTKRPSGRANNSVSPKS